MPTRDQLRLGIMSAAQELGVSPLDLATAISYETAGTFNPEKAGPTTKWGRHRGLIQWGEPQAQKYLGGDFSIPAQSKGMVAYLRDTGVQPGMGLLDIYSAINAGGVGRYDRSDAHAGGAPGTVKDKVEKQMAGHRAKAEALFGGTLPEIATAASTAPQASPSSQYPTSPEKLPPAILAAMSGQEAKADNPLMSNLSGAGQMLAMLGGGQQQPPPPQLKPMQPQQSAAPSLQDYIAQYMQSRMRA